MPDAAWFGLSHGRAWADVGQSFAELADSLASQPPSSPGPEATLTAAGTRSSAKPKGAGSFQLETEWQLSDRPEGDTYNTEASDHFKQPPKGARPAVSQAARGKRSNFPKETYPTDFRTSKQQDFAADRLANVKAPVRAFRPKESETAALIRPGFPPVTSTARVNKAQTQHNSVSAPASTDIMGKTRLVADVRTPAFNIINGCEVASVEKLKYWNGQHMDYRRRR